MKIWLFISFIAPILWSFVVLLDIYFTQKAYDEAAEGSIISGFYQGIVLILLLFIHYSWPSSGWMFFIAGMCFLWACHWYLRSLIIGGDGTLAQIVWNFSIVLVPVLAWFISSERLLPIHYAGIAVVFIGGAIFAWKKDILIPDFWSIIINMIPAVLGLSLSMTIQKRAFEISPDFLTGFLTFSMGIIVASVTIFAIHKQKKGLVDRIIGLSRRYWMSFLLGETMSVVALSASSLAIKLSPSVSFVAVVESLVPVFVMVFSFIVARILFWKEQFEYQSMYMKQIIDVRGKLGAICIIAIGIYLVT